MYFKGGDRYEGDWLNHKMEGKGIYFWAIGDIYQGDWKNDTLDGKGIFYYKNGDREMGDYIEGRAIGMHVRLRPNGTTLSERYPSS